ncbi:MAG: site-specific integrase, partial [Microcystis aeruginosa Ma_QC_Ch_20071001_M135]
MKKIPNTDCSFTEPWVSPPDWKKATKSSLNKTWYVQAYFFDPLFADKYPKGFPFRKKLNKLATIEERKMAAKLYLEEIPRLFLDKGYNPITKNFMFDVKEESDCEISEKSFINEALQYAFKNIKVADSTNTDIKSVIKYFTRSVEQLRLHRLAIGEVKRKHIRAIIDNIEKNEGEFSGHKFNKYRSYLQILFSELVEHEIIEVNVITGIRKRKQEKKIRQTLTPEQRELVNNHLRDHWPDFWRFVNIFFHSGARTTELLRLQVKDVDL